MRLVFEYKGDIIVLRTSVLFVGGTIMNSTADTYNDPGAKAKSISLGDEFNYVQFVYYKGIKYYNIDYQGNGEKIILQKL
jgi:hypothetical protein